MNTWTYTAGTAGKVITEKIKRTFNEELKVRLKTFVWNMVFISVGSALEYAANNVTSIGLPPLVGAVAGLFFAQASKAWANKKAGKW